MSNQDTGEMMVHTWDRDLKTRRPIEGDSITVGSGGNDATLTPYPDVGDSAGMSSRFYGQADWARGADVRRGWMEGRGMGDRQEFEWKHGWEAGRMQGGMDEMGGLRSMGPGHGPGRRGGGMNK